MKTQKTKIEFDWDDKHIVLEYTADSLRKMEDRGFDIGVIDKKLLTLGEKLFSGAFIANHDNIDESVRMEIYKDFAESSEDDKSVKIDDVSAKMFEEALDEMQSHRGNVKWRMTS